MSYKAKLKDIRAFVFDVDGVFTDGTILLLPDGSMSRTMNVLDGYAVVKAVKASYPIAVITGGDDPAVRRRFQYLGVTEYYPKSLDKKADLHHFITRHGLQPSELLCMGDDLPDIAMFPGVGIAACPANAVPEVKLQAHYISPIAGGQGAVRDVIEQVLKVQGKWITDLTPSV